MNSKTSLLAALDAAFIRMLVGMLVLMVAGAVVMTQQCTGVLLLEAVALWSVLVVLYLWRLWGLVKRWAAATGGLPSESRA